MELQKYGVETTDARNAFHNLVTLTFDLLTSTSMYAESLSRY